MFDKMYLKFYAEKDKLMWGTAPSPGVVSFAEFLKGKEMLEAIVLDSGCGEGRNSIYLAKQGFRVYGLDISAVAIEKARQWAEREGLLEKIWFEVGDVSQMEFRDEFFDAAIDINTINFVKARRKYVAELSRVLKPKGYLLLETLSRESKEYGISKDELEWLITPFFEILEMKEFHAPWGGQNLLHYRILAQNR
ncbi:MAG: hypothetical protein DRO05_04245 [Thermoproteota archaeon]|nr:MAG: hypothetical protein DRO05_04245 [Candidatus Korarchaeota archaeon]